MRVLTERDKPFPEDCVGTLGKFESIHRGHQYLIQETQRIAANNRLPAAVLTFEPHPRRTLYDSSYQPIFTAKERRYILEKWNIDYLWEHPFDRDFAALTPEQFSEMLFGKLRVRILVVGEDIRFGKGRVGTAEYLMYTARSYNAEVVVLPHRAESGQKIGTSEIREKLLSHDMEGAANWLGFYFFIMGEVQHGKEIGRTLGFPTVNLKPDKEKLLPPNGVYATLTKANGHFYRSVTNVGVKPTVDGASSKRGIESFLLDFSGDLYGQEVITAFISYIRPEQRFAHLDALKVQINHDAHSVAQANFPADFF